MLCIYRISSSGSRSALLRSPTTSHWRRSFHSTRPRNAAAGKKIPLSTQEKLVDTLQARYGQYSGRGKRVAKADTKRINVVSEKLCDDILERMKPSFAKHMGCDIIDINPGPGVWSSKIHDLLKPRTHILMEPDSELYLPLLQPLLDAEGSSYKFIPKSGAVWGYLNRAVSEEYLPHQPQLQTTDPELEKPNDSLLFIANLSYHPRKPYRGFPSLSLLMIHQFLSAIRSHSLFQRYGLVRMLIWVADNDKKVVLPRTVAHRKKFSAEAETCCENIFDIASSTDGVGLFRRQHHLDLESSMAVLEKMKKAGIKTPKGRQGAMQEEASKILAGGKTDKENIARPFWKELEELETRFAAGEFTEWIDPNLTQEMKNKNRFKDLRTPLFNRLRQLRFRGAAEKRKGGVFNDLFKDFDAITAMRVEALTLDPENAELLQKEIDQRAAEWKSAVESKSTLDQSLFMHQLDNRRTFRKDSPLLLWDKREAEPLKVRADEFFPEHELCLLDFHPKPKWDVFQRDYPANYDIYEFILGSLFIVPTQSVRKGLTALSPGAWEWLLPECPSLTDPTKGGGADLDLMTVRCLTQEMLQEIMEAWMRWPFRPSRYELMARIGSNAHDPDEEPGEMK